MTDKKFGHEGKPTKKKGIEANLGQKDAQIDKEKHTELAGMGRLPPEGEASRPRVISLFRAVRLNGALPVKPKSRERPTRRR